MTFSPTEMSLRHSAQVLARSSTSGSRACVDPTLVDTVNWPSASTLSLAIDSIIRDALSAGLTLPETYQQVRTTLIAQGVQPDVFDLDRYVREHILGAS
jgi:hypothetical protein